MTDPILSKIAKLLALADSARGASEAEASLAAEHVQRLLQEHNLTLSQVEAAGGTSDHSTQREKRVTAHRAMYGWQRNLMATVANNNFCLHVVRKLAVERKDGTLVRRPVHSLVGRTLNVQATQQTYEYLTSAMRQLADEAGYTPTTFSARMTFYEGAVARLSERLVELRSRREAEDAVRPTSGNGTHRELVLSDVYGSESDLNNDTLNNFPAGTTATKRREAEARTLRRELEETRLVAEGIDPTVAFYRAYGYSEEQSVQHAASYTRRSKRAGRGYSQRWTQGDSRHHQKINSAPYKAGRQAGDDIGLDPQVGTRSTKLIR